MLSPLGRLPRASVCVLALMLLGGCGAPGVIGVQDRGTVVGTVIDAKTLQPIVNARVYASSEDSVFSLPPMGQFSLQVPIGQQQISAYFPGYAVNSVTVNIPMKGDIVNLETAIALTPTS